MLHFLVTIPQAPGALRTRIRLVSISHRGWSIFWQFGYWLITNKKPQTFPLPRSGSRLQEVREAFHFLLELCAHHVNKWGASWSLRSHMNNTLDVLGKPGQVPRSPASWCANRWENSGKISRAANPTQGQPQIEDQTCCPTDSLIHEQYQILLGLPGWSGG